MCWVGTCRYRTKGHDRQRRPRACADREVRHTGPGRGGVPAEVRQWSAPIEWSGLIVSAWSVSGLSGRCFLALVDGIPESYAAERCCTTQSQNTHGTDECEVLYPWHPWTGRAVHVHDVIAKAGWAAFRCSLSGISSDRRLCPTVCNRDRRAARARGARQPIVAGIAVQLQDAAKALQDLLRVHAARLGW